MRAFLGYVLRDLLHYRFRTFLTVLGLGGVAFSYIILAAMSESMYSFGVQVPVTRNLVIIADKVIDPTQGKIAPEVIQAAADLGADLVRVVSPMIYRALRVEGQIVQIRAADMADWERVYNLSLLEGRWPEGEREAVISEGAAHLAGWSVGEHISVYGSDFRISGLVRASGTKFASLWMSVPEALRLFGEDAGYQAAVVQLTADANMDNVRAELSADPRLAGRYGVYLEDRLSAQVYSDVIRDVRTLIMIVTGLALLGIVLGAYNAARLSVAERGRELGILRAIGFSARTGGVFIMIRLAMQALLAYVFGVAAAALFVTSMQSRQNVLVCTVCQPLKLSAASVAIGLTLVLALAPFGAWLSTRQTMRLTVAEAIGRSSGAAGA